MMANSVLLVATTPALTSKSKSIAWSPLRPTTTVQLYLPRNRLDTNMTRIRLIYANSRRNMSVSATTTSESNYLIFDTKKVGPFGLIPLLFSRKDVTEHTFVESSREIATELNGIKFNFLNRVIFVLNVVLRIIRFPFRLVGETLVFFLNFMSINGGILGLLWHAITVSIKLPNKRWKEYKSVVALMDDRVEFFGKDVTSINSSTLTSNLDKSPKEPLKGVTPMELSIMASKIAYENEEYIKNVVNNRWKMNFLGYFECWNKYTSKKDTKAFIFSDKPSDATVIVLTFCGMDLLNVDHWLSDFDQSYLEMGHLGKLHLGYLKSMGVQDDKDHTKAFPNAPENLIKPWAYYTLRSRLATLLSMHPKAKVLVTGHGVGGALAVLFVALLGLHQQGSVLGRVYRIITHAQPRVGDQTFGRYMEGVVRADQYVRTTFRYDLIPRTPFDSPPASPFRHFGTCVYFKDIYTAKLIKQEPNTNYFSFKFLIEMHTLAMLDVVRAILAGIIQGEEFKESFMSILVRLAGVAVPGPVAHSPRDYVNATRLARLSNKPSV